MSMARVAMGSLLSLTAPPHSGWQKEQKFFPWPWSQVLPVVCSCARIIHLGVRFPRPAPPCSSTPVLVLCSAPQPQLYTRGIQVLHFSGSRTHQPMDTSAFNELPSPLTGISPNRTVLTRANISYICFWLGSTPLSQYIPFIALCRVTQGQLLDLHVT